MPESFKDKIEKLLANPDALYKNFMTLKNNDPVIEALLKIRYELRSAIEDDYDFI